MHRTSTSSTTLLAWLMSLAMLLAGCASAPPPLAPALPDVVHWTFEREVDTSAGTISLFDPRDLAHHQHDPDDWMQYRFAFENDLETGRFAAVLTGRNGTHRVRVTSGPLGEFELAAAGPQATQRLRVLNRRLLLAGGGDAWPSRSAPRLPKPTDSRWLSIPNGDYKVTTTVIDSSQRRGLPDVVFRLEAMDSFETVAYAPGMPQLLLGAGPAVAGTDTSVLRYVEKCSAVPRQLPWSPLTHPTLPVPGRTLSIRLPEPLHDRRLTLQAVALPANQPILVSRETAVGTLGVQFTPSRWLEPRREEGRYREVFEAEGRTDCAVRITGISGVGDDLRLDVEPVPMPRESLPPDLMGGLVERFEAYSAMSSDPAWRYKSGRVRHAPDDTSKVLAVMDQLQLRPSETEALLPMDNEARARWLLQRMQQPL